MGKYPISKLLKLINILSEIILALVVYLISNFLRLHMSGSMLKPYFSVDIIGYIPYGIVMAGYYVIAYLLLGDYKTLHYRSVGWVLKRVTVVSILGAMVGSSIMFWMQDRQMSRGLLIIHTVLAIILFSLKRIIVSSVSKKHIEKKDKYKVLVYGNSKNIVKYAKELIIGRELGYEYAGYINSEDCLDIPMYRGSIDNLETILEETGCNLLVVSEDGMSMDRLDMIMSKCKNRNIDVKLIPVFSDYFDERTGITKTREGTKLVLLSEKQTTNILGVNIAITNIDEVINKISVNLEKWRGQYICVSNVHTTVMSYENKEYCNVQNGAVIALPDGGPLSSYSRSHGISNAERVTGPDLMKKILEMSSKNGWRHFFYGASQETLDKLRKVINERYPGIEIAGMISPPFRELSSDEEAEYVKQINETKPDFVWVGLGAPKQEFWMARQKDKVNALMIGVGAAFDYESGNIKRAPKWMQKCSLEWLYRLFQDPKRLFKRYFVTNIKYIWLTRR